LRPSAVAFAREVPNGVLKLHASRPTFPVVLDTLRQSLVCKVQLGDVLCVFPPTTLLFLEPALVVHHLKE